MQDLLKQVIDITRQASTVVMEIYNSDDFGVQIKSDDSPLTKADVAANDIIEVGLKRISDWPILSEEGEHQIDAETFWCVDPIDGTKDFIKRSGEFTINIGFIKNGEPVLGVVGVPAQDVIYYGAKGYGAYKQSGTDQPVKIEAKFDGSVPVVANHSKVEPELQEFLDKLGKYELRVVGSSLKFCMVADGSAAVYPRFYGSHVWDTAAADAVVRAAGGSVTAIDGQALIYRPAASLLNPLFIVRASNFAAQ